MHVPFRMGVEQQLPPISWIPNTDSQHIMLPEDPNLLPHRWVNQLKETSNPIAKIIFLLEDHVWACSAHVYA